jgi:hypothetical protein
LTDALAARVADPFADRERAGFRDAELALLRALPRLRAESAESALAGLREHFDADADRGEIGQIVYAYGMYKGLHSANAALGVEILDERGIPLSERAGFSVVTQEDGRFARRSDFDLP